MQANVVLVMGVSGCGKTVTGALLAGRLGWNFIDADDHHPSANVEKMRRGEPLNDADRAPWLAHLNTLLREHADAVPPRSTVLACSALKTHYRSTLLDGLPHARIVYLQGSQELLAARLAARNHAYMPPTLLASQLAALEAPSEALIIDVATPLDDVVSQIIASL